MNPATPANQSTETRTTRRGTVTLTTNADGSIEWIARDPAGHFVARDTAPTRAYALTDGMVALIRTGENEHGLVWADFRKGWVPPASLGLIP